MNRPAFLRPFPATLGALALVLPAGGCGTEPRDASIQGSYSVDYDPAWLVSATLDCDHNVPYAILSVGDDGGFGLSVNVMDDCTRAGGDWEYGEVYTDGTYTRQGDSLSFREDGAGGAAFQGSVTGEFIDLTLPPAVGVAPLTLDLHLGPRQPF